MAMIKHMPFYFLVAIATGFSTAAGQTKAVQAVNDNIQLNEDETKIINVLKNDKLESRNNLDLKLLSDPSLGTADLQGFDILFTPNANVSGVDEFLYSIDDGFSSDTAKIKITIVSMNDAPTSVKLVNNTITENGPDV
ncbi:MAG: cadherin-like domain-containing protein, partial [Nitrospinaceae bacterium]|nr:cadherin-like domain-containing protein [Nitrospinaceae bacterium]